MNEQMYGVFFRDQGVTEYLVAAAEDQEAAISEARGRDEVAFDEAMEKHADAPDDFPEPTEEDFDGMHYVEPISRELAEASSYELERNIAVRMR
jgi:hypothetical protein